MSTLLLRLAAPMQAWGSDSKFSTRMTNREPTKSGVIGLIACALGRQRTDSIEDLARINFGVRIDQHGKLIRDFHMAHKLWGAKTEQTSFLSERYYLSDAIFLVGIEAEDSLLEEIEVALKNPKFPLFLGRRSCPPTLPITLGIKTGVGLAKALSEEEWLAEPWYKKKQPLEVKLEIVRDAHDDKSEYLSRDVPLSFNQLHRKYAFRDVVRGLSEPLANPDGQANHDPMEF